MAQKDIIYGDEARQKLKAGVDKIANAVTTTLGPKGRNVAFETAWNRPKVVHDGVTVAKEVELKDSFEDMGAQLAREASEKTNDVAGDGTTASILLTQAIVTEGLRNISSGISPMALRNGLEEATKKVVEEIKRISKKVSTKEEKEQVATISAQDKLMGKLIAEAMEKVGDKGVITIEEGKGFDLELEYKEGLQFDRGYASPYFVTDTERMETVINDSNILFVDYRLDNVQELVIVLGRLTKQSKNIVIIAEDFSDEVLATLVLNKVRGVANILAVKAPGVSNRRSDRMEDMAIFTGASLISKSKGSSLVEATVDVLGSVDKVISTRDDTILMGGRGKKSSIKERVKHISKRIDNSPTEFDREKLKERLGALSNGIAVLNVGAASETELRERKLRVEDAVNATKAAVEEGIVPGGGVALLNSRKVIEDSQDIGHKIVFNALRYPITKILKNAGLDAGEIIAGLKEKNQGYNVVTMQYEDMIKTGIIDPSKVIRSALQNAVSVAIMILTTDCLIVETKEEKEKKPSIPRYPGPVK